MKARRFFAAVIIILMAVSVTGQSSTEADYNAHDFKNYCAGQNIDLSSSNSQGSVRKDIVYQITGDMSDSRMAGIVILLLLIGTTLYAGFR